jgi:hypothetical protein
VRLRRVRRRARHGVRALFAPRCRGGRRVDAGKFGFVRSTTSSPQASRVSRGDEPRSGAGARHRHRARHRESSRPAWDLVFVCTPAATAPPAAPPPSRASRVRDERATASGGGPPGGADLVSCRRSHRANGGVNVRPARLCANRCQRPRAASRSPANRELRLFVRTGPCRPAWA